MLKLLLLPQQFVDVAVIGLQVLAEKGIEELKYFNLKIIF